MAATRPISPAPVPTPEQAGLSVDVQGSITVIRFLDRRLIDAQQIQRAGDTLNGIAKASAKPRMLIDFDKVEYLSSSAVGILMQLQTLITQRKGRMALAGMDPEIRKLFTMLKLQKMLTLCDTLEEARRSLSK